MGPIEKSVFLSYRRSNLSWAFAIYQHLTFHGYDVFLDYLKIPSGDFERNIFANIRARGHFLMLLTPSALERCIDPNDLFRREIETAMRERRNVVPVLFDGFDFATPGIASQLVGELANLKRYNSLTVSAEFIEPALERLRNTFLNTPVDAVLHPETSVKEQVAIQQQTAPLAVVPVKNEELKAEQEFENGFAATDVDDQLRYFNEAIRLKPDYGAAYYYRAKTRLSKGDVKGAKEDYRHATRFDPDIEKDTSNRRIHKILDVARWLLVGPAESLRDIFGLESDEKKD